jgi:hypothetical protein
LHTNIQSEIQSWRTTITLTIITIGHISSYD